MNELTGYDPPKKSIKVEGKTEGTGAANPNQPQAAGAPDYWPHHHHHHHPAGNGHQYGNL